MLLMRVVYFLLYVLIFLRELVKSNIQVAKLVLSPNPAIRPGFLAVPMRAKTDFEITSLANSITLTPGTITVHVERDKQLLVVHALDIGADPDETRRDIKTTLEDNILRWTRPSADEPPAARPQPQRGAA